MPALFSKNVPFFRACSTGWIVMARSVVGLQAFSPYCKDFPWNPSPWPQNLVRLFALSSGSSRTQIRFNPLTEKASPWTTPIPDSITRSFQKPARSMILCPPSFQVTSAYKCNAPSNLNWFHFYSCWWLADTTHGIQMPSLSSVFHDSIVLRGSGLDRHLTAKWFHLTWELHCYLIHLSAPRESNQTSC